MSHHLAPSGGARFALSDITQELDIDYGHGQVVTVPAHSARIYLEIWPNAFVEVLYYTEPQTDADPSDRIHLMVTGTDRYTHGLLLNVADAIGIISGLSKGIQLALAERIPTQPGEPDVPTYDAKGDEPDE